MEEFVTKLLVFEGEHLDLFLVADQVRFEFLQGPIIPLGVFNLTGEGFDDIFEPGLVLLPAVALFPHAVFPLPHLFELPLELLDILQERGLPRLPNDTLGRLNQAHETHLRLVGQLGHVLHQLLPRGQYQEHILHEAVQLPQVLLLGDAVDVDVHTKPQALVLTVLLQGAKELLEITSTAGMGVRLERFHWGVGQVQVVQAVLVQAEL